MNTSRSRGLLGWMTRHRVGVSLVLVYLFASPLSAFDDRQLLKTTAGANTNVLVILDSSTSMNNEFGDLFRLPAYMDDFIYPSGTDLPDKATRGSKIAVAKSVLRQVLSSSTGVNWAFSYYRNPNQRLGTAFRGIPAGPPDGGAQVKGDYLRNGGLEWLYMAAGRDPDDSDVSLTFPASQYPDIQSGRFLQLGHKVMRNYELENGIVVGPLSPDPSPRLADSRFPYSPLTDTTGNLRGADPRTGVWRGAFGPFGDATMVVYRHPSTMPNTELRLQMIRRGTNPLSSQDIYIDVAEYGPPPTPTLSPTPSNTPTPTNTPTDTQTPTATITLTPSNTPTFTTTPTATITLTPTNTFTGTQTPSATNTFTATPTMTSTFTSTRTSTATRTFTRTQTFTVTQTPTKTLTPTITQTPTSTFTPTRTFTGTLTPSNTRTPTNTRTFTKTQTFTRTQTFTQTQTDTPVPPTNTPTITQTPTKTDTPLPPTATFTSTRTFTVTQTPTKTNTPLPPTATFTSTRTFTLTPVPPTPTFTVTPSLTPVPPTATNTPPPPTATRTKTAIPSPTLVPTEPQGLMPAGSRLPVVANWFSAMTRGILAMAPPPPPVPSPAVPCRNLGIPPAYDPNPLQPLLCGPCPGTYPIDWTCAFRDIDNSGDRQPGEDHPLPADSRGFDDPQADPDLTLTATGRHVVIHFKRADLYGFPEVDPNYTPDPSYDPYQSTAEPNVPDIGNPPWGSQPGDADADAVPDSLVLSPADRQNQGMYAASFDQALRQNDQQFPMDAQADSSCAGAPNPCNPYFTDCGGIAHYNVNRPDKADGSGNPFVAYTSLIPPASATWPVLPFQRADWVATDASNVPVIKRLLRFVSSIVSFDPNAGGAMQAYRLEERANNVIVTAPGTPIAGVLFEAYQYFKQAVIPDATATDPAKNCREYIIVYITDGIDECNSSAATCLGAGQESDAAAPGGINSNDGVAGDLGRIKLPGVRTSTRQYGIPVFMVAMGLDATNPQFTCITHKSAHPEIPYNPLAPPENVFSVRNRQALVDALNSIISYKPSTQFFSAPSLPAFASGSGSVGEIGAVVPSHALTNIDPVNPPSSIWSVWTGSLKAWQLDSQGKIPVIVGSTATPGGPTVTPTPVGGTAATFPDETLPNDPSEALRKPVWNASRVLGYTDPTLNLSEGASSGSPVVSPAGKEGPIKVWPGRKMIWSQQNGTNIPFVRKDFLPSDGTRPPDLVGGFPTDELMTAMGFDPALLSDRKRARWTVWFLRGGQNAPDGTITAAGGPKGSRDEVLSQVPTKPGGPAIGPNITQQYKYSYWFQDDIPQPGTAPQVRTDPGPPDGYPHKLGDIFHSEVRVLEPPRYFQYLVANPNNYLGFATTHAQRRRVAFVGANDGFLHAFDAGVFDRDASFPLQLDLGTGREIFAYAPPTDAAPAAFDKLPTLIRFPPQPQYFVDGPQSLTDAFIDPAIAGVPVPGNRQWRSLLVGGERQGGNYYYALDVTQPDSYTSGAAKADKSPDCLNGLGAGCVDKYPQIRWEFTDTVAPALGQTWSRPVLGRIKIHNGGNALDTDRYVAIFGGGLDLTFTPGDTPTGTTQGRAIYIVSLETGSILSKLTQAFTDNVTATDLAPTAANMAAVDYDDDGYLDVAYVGDMNGRMIRVDLTPGGPSLRGECNNCGAANETLTGYKPFVLFDSTSNSQAPIAPATTHVEPIFLDAGVVFIQGGAPPLLGISFGTGYRPDLISNNDSRQRFYFIKDDGASATSSPLTLLETDLTDLTPSGTGLTGSKGFFLNFENDNEKTLTTVFSTNGLLTLVTFTRDGIDPCGVGGASFSYRFLYSTGTAGYRVGDPGVDYSGYRLSLGPGLASEGQSISPEGKIIDTVLFSGGAVRQDDTGGNIRTLNKNWKEQQP